MFCTFIIIINAYFIDISQDSIETHLWCGEVCNKHVIANCRQSVPIIKFENRSIIGEDIDKSKVLRFLAHSVECRYDNKRKHSFKHKNN